MVTFIDQFSLSPFAKELLDMFPVCKVVTFPEELPKNQFNNRNQGMVAYKVRKDYMQFALGIPSPAHEVAHMVEMNTFSRLIQDDWGLRNSIDKTSSASFFAAFAREARVRGIQHHLDKTSTFSNEFWFETASNHLPFGKFKDINEVRDWISTIFSNTRDRWSLDRIRYEWERRVTYIRNWQES